MATKRPPLPIQATADSLLHDLRAVLDQFHDAMDIGLTDKQAAAYAYELYDRAETLNGWLRDGERPLPTDWKR